MSKQALQDAKLEYGHKNIQLSEMYPVIQEVLQGGGTFRLTITGCSMWPTILGGRDQVTLSQPPQRLQKYDLPLYRRKSGQFVLHRIVAVEEDGTYICCGDHQWQLEKGLRQEQMVGLATTLVRKGKTIDVTDRRYCRWVHFWVWMLPCRHAIFSVYRFFSRIGELARAALRKVFFKKKK
ncbi:MAG: S24/S26 family peptidase [Firmicutes bacterium]|nr:S24/S26 family peptidase [Bacillota bacterium]MDY2720450.1 S24/S26 family peptidase [Candidatus Faecousia sp.]